MISKNKLNRLDKDKNTPKDKDKTEHKDMLDKISNKISTINETSTILVEIKVKLKNKQESMCELQDDDSWLRLVELNKLDSTLDDALNVIWNMIYKRKLNKLKHG